MAQAMQIHRATRAEGVEALRFVGDEQTLNGKNLVDLQGQLQAFQAEQMAGLEHPPRILVLESGHDSVFCRGMDLKSVHALSENELQDECARYVDCLRLIRSASLPVVALIDGEVAGGGVGLAAAADRVIATARSTFALPEGILGLVPAMVLPILLERMSPRAAMNLAWEGQAVSADSAKETSLIDHVVADAKGLEKAFTRFAKTLFRMRPGAVQSWKALVNRMSASNASEMSKLLQLGSDCTSQMLLDAEVRNGIQAWLDGELPSWHQRYRKGGSR